jgi:hypothetical protein
MDRIEAMGARRRFLKLPQVYIFLYSGLAAVVLFDTGKDSPMAHVDGVIHLFCHIT